MKKLVCFFVFIISITGIGFAQDNYSSNNGYYMGPGMMWGNGGGNWSSGSGSGSWGPGMMGYWMDHGWNDYGKSKLNLTQQQQSQWDNTVSQGRTSQQAINDSINYYVNEIHRLQQAKSPLVQDDLNQIRQILTPQQYTQFLEKLVTGNPND